MSGETISSFSENIEMYLVTVARLSEIGEPVSLSQLAEVLSISPVSVNEMCRKLQEVGQLEYRPYKGVILTQEGRRRAQFILRCHRIWEVFLVANLCFTASEAHQLACQLEHGTSHHLADRLHDYLGKPVVNPDGDVIPELEEKNTGIVWVSLGSLFTGQTGIVRACEGDEETGIFLEQQGLGAASRVTVLADNRNTLLVETVNGRVISILRTLADGVKVERTYE